MTRLPIIAIAAIIIASFFAFTYLYNVVDVKIDSEIRHAYNQDIPLAQLQNDIEGLLYERRVASLVLLGSIGASVLVIVFMASKARVVLEALVKAKTKELEHSNEELAIKNEQLRKNDQAQKEFINIAAHELRTPIQPLVGVAELLGAELANNGNNMDDDEIVGISKAEIKMIIRNAERLERLSSDLLMVTKVESQGIALNIERIDLNNLVLEVIEDVKRQITISNSYTQIIYGGKTGPSIFVDADKTKIAQVMHNLLHNATKFANNGMIVVELDLSDSSDDKRSTITVRVRDNGCGIDERIMPQLFTKFSSNSAGGGGTGLGLYISKRIIDAHGGRIWGENNKSGKGATFGFSLKPSPSLQQHSRSAISTWQ